MKFYSLRFDPSYKDIQYASDTDWATIICPVHDGHQRAGHRIGPLRFSIIDRIDREFYWTNLSELVITENVLGLLKEADVSGFNVARAELINRPSDLTFFEFMPTGNGGMADNIEMRYECEFCGAKDFAEKSQPKEEHFLELKKGINVNPANWDGSDVFTVIGPSRIILITDKVKQLIEQNKLNGVVIAHAEDFKKRVY